MMMSVIKKCQVDKSRSIHASITYKNSEHQNKFQKGEFQMQDFKFHI